jgi:hypothetical protein
MLAPCKEPDGSPITGSYRSHGTIMYIATPVWLRRAYANA